MVTSAAEIVMPQMGADMEEGTLLRWIKHPGEHVSRGEIIAEIETDKANVEIEAFEDGVLTETLVQEGQTVPVGQPIARLTPGATASAALATPAPAMQPPPAAPGDGKAAQAAAPAAAPAVDTRLESRAIEPDKRDTPATAPVVGAPTEAEEGEPEPVAGDGQRLRISPVARHLAEQMGIDVRALRGSGPDGRIMRRDVEAAAESRGVHVQEVETVPRGWTRESPAAAAAVPQPEPVRPAPATVSETLTPAAAQLGTPAETAPVAPAPQRPAAPAPSPAAPAPPSVAASTSPAASREAPATALEPLSRMRQAIARRMAQSKREAPHYYVTMEVDMTEAAAFRASVNQAAGEGGHVTVNDLIVKACAATLRRYPRFNAFYSEEGLRPNERINICIAIALPDGLIAPALLDVADKSLGAIAREARDLGERARSGGLRPAELNDGTFTISNLGMYGIETLIPIIQPPQAAILGVGAVQDKPAVRDGQVVVRKLMTVALAADHRVTDGAQGAEFLRELKALLERPVSLAL